VKVLISDTNILFDIIAIKALPEFFGLDFEICTTFIQKSTKLSRETPFDFTRNELNFSSQHAEDYHLYRLFNLSEEAKMFIKKGDLGNICHAVPITFQGYF